MALPPPPPKEVRVTGSRGSVALCTSPDSTLPEWELREGDVGGGDCISWSCSCHRVSANLLER